MRIALLFRPDAFAPAFRWCKFRSDRTAEASWGSAFFLLAGRPIERPVPVGQPTAEISRPDLEFSPPADRASLGVSLMTRGDGKVFGSEMERAVRIRTREEGTEAL